MTSNRKGRPSTTVNFVNITSGGSVPTSEDAQPLKDLCYEVCACPDLSRTRGSEKSDISRVDTKFDRLGRSQNNMLCMLARVSELLALLF